MKTFELVLSIMFVTDVSTTFLRDPVTWRMRHHHSKHHGTETTILPPVNQYVNITVNNFNVSVVSNHREKTEIIHNNIPISIPSRYHLVANSMQQRNISHPSSEYYSLGLISKRSKMLANAINLSIFTGRDLKLPSKYKIIAIRGWIRNSGSLVLPLVLLPETELLPPRSVPLKYAYRPRDAGATDSVLHQVFQLAAIDIGAHPFPSPSFVLELRINQPLLASFHSPPNHHMTESKLNLEDDIPDNPAIHPRLLAASDHSTDNAFKDSAPLDLMNIRTQRDGNNNMSDSVQSINKKRKLPSFWSLFA